MLSTASLKQNNCFELPRFPLKKLLVGILLVLAIGLGYQKFENSLIYNPTAVRYPNVTRNAIANPVIRSQVQILHFNSLDGTRLTAWYVPAQKLNPTILYAHGNGGNVASGAGLLTSFVQKGYGFFTLDYRGYGKSHGDPSEQGLYQDVKAASQLLANDYHIPISKQVLMGASLGGAVAVEVAQNQPYKAVVILSSFTSAIDMGYVYLHQWNIHFLDWLPLSLMVRQPFNSIQKVQNIHEPLLIIHSHNDTFIPFTMGQKLYNAAIGTTHKKLYVDNYWGHSLTRGLVSKQVIAFLSTK